MGCGVRERRHTLLSVIAYNTPLLSAGKVSSCQCCSDKQSSAGGGDNYNNRTYNTSASLCYTTLYVPKP